MMSLLRKRHPIIAWNNVKKYLLFSFLFLEISLVFLYAGKGYGQERSPGDKTLWVSFLEFKGGCQSGNLPGTLSALRQLRRWELRQGRKDVPPVTSALLDVYRHSLLFKRSNRYERLSILEGICTLSPDDPELQWVLLKRQFLATPFGIGAIFKRIKALERAMTCNLGWRWNRGGQLLLSLIFGLFLTVFWMALLMCLKYLPVLFFQIRKGLKRVDHPLLALGGLITLLLLPVYFQIGLVWWFLYILVILWLFMSKKEKIGVVFLLVLLSVLSLEMKNVGRFFTAAANHDSYLLYLANYSFSDPVSIQHLNKKTLGSHRDPETLFTLGLLEKRKGHYKLAENYYQSALWDDSSFAECMNNLANVYLLTKDNSSDRVTLARIWYRKALKIDPNKAEFYYNLGRTYPPLDPQRVKYLVKARVLNPQLVDRLSKLTSNASDRGGVDCLLPIRRIWNRSMIPNVTATEFSLMFWRFYLNSPQDRIFVVPAMLILLLFLGIHFRHRLPRVVPCDQCGQFYPAEHIEQGMSSLCPTCRMLKKNPEQSDPELVKKKRKEVIRYQRKKRFVILFAGFFPAGGGFLRNGKFFAGLCTAFLFYSFLSYYLITHQYFSNMSLWFYGYSSRSPFFLVGAILLYGVSLVTLVRAFLRRKF